MNEFNKEQLAVIESLARGYFQRAHSWVTDNDIPRDVLQKLEDQYVENITKGLTDPDHWKDLTE